MARILFGSNPASGHVRPGLPIARELVGRGHDVVWYTSDRFKASIDVTRSRPSAGGRRHLRGQERGRRTRQLSGAGINLKTETSSPEQVRTAVRTLLEDPSYRVRARALQAHYAEHDAGATAATLVESLLAPQADHPI